MTKLHRVAYAALLTLMTLMVMPTLASAQEASRGHFTLTHEVHWQHAIVPAGDYKFALKSRGASSLITMQKVSGAATGFILFANETSQADSSSNLSQLVLVSRNGRSFVSAMELPEFGQTLRFTVPSESPEPHAAQTSALSSASSAR